MPERARLSLGLSVASGALQLGAWALFFLPFATLSVAVADPAGPGDLTAASRRDPGYLPWAIGAMLVTGVASAAGAVALAMWGVARGAARPRAAAGLALLGALVAVPFALAPGAASALDAPRAALAVLALLAALAALALAGRGRLRGTPG